MRFRGEVGWFYLLLKCVRIGEKADRTHAIQTVLLLRNPLRIRRHLRRRRPHRLPQPQPSPRLYPSPPSLQHHSSRSVFLFALSLIAFSSSPLSLITSPRHPSQSHYNIHSAAKVLNTIEILPYKSLRT